LKEVKASRTVIVAINTIMSFDAYYAIRSLLAYYGLSKFINAIFWMSLVM